MASSNRSERVSKMVLEEFEQDLFEITKTMDRLEEQVILLQKELPETIQKAHDNIEEKAASTIEDINSQLRNEVNLLLSSELGEYKGRVDALRSSLEETISEKFNNSVDQSLAKVEKAKQGIAESTEEAGRKIEAYQKNVGGALKRLESGKWLKTWMAIFYVMAIITIISSGACTFAVMKLISLYYS